jgi:vacuolar protein sorting-associated protein 13A/C
VNIRLSSSNLTKLVTFTPYYMMVNHTSFTIQCQEGDRPWTDIEPANCSPLWPKGLSHHANTLKLKVKGTNEMTAPFSFAENHTVLLKLHNKVCVKPSKVSLLARARQARCPLVVPSASLCGARKLRVFFSA